MGMHTWFVKDKKVYKELERLYNIAETSSEFDSQIDLLYKQNETEYHDLFRTNKREKDGTYCQDIIESKKECDEWIKNNKETIYYLNEEKINEFWDKYPNGLVYFG